MRYIRWDYDKGEAVEFRRDGECNGCGMCCMARITFKVSQTPEFIYPAAPGVAIDTNNGGDTTDVNGQWSEIVFDNEARRFFKITSIDLNDIHLCPLLTAEKRYQKHNHVNNLCSEWPMAPEQVTPFPDCSFTFTEINRWPIEQEVAKVETL